MIASQLVEGLMAIVAALYVAWQLDQLNKRVHRLEWESPLREFMTVSIELERAFFSEALKLPDDEIDNPDMVRAIWLRLQTWKEHYTGDVSFHERFGEEPLKQASIYKLPTSAFQFPVQLAQYPLFGKAFEEKEHWSNFGARGPEKLVVLLSHKSIIIRACDGCFPPGPTSGHCYSPSPSDLVIPIRRRSAGIREQRGPR